MSLPKAAILSVGDELLEGRVAATNAAWLASRLAEAGFSVIASDTVGDDEFGIADAVRDLAGRADLVLVAGGLGPTPDDITREGLAGAAGTLLSTHRALKKQIAERTGGRAPRKNARMARLPDGAAPVPNHVGSAPGIRMELSGAIVYALPGVPLEMEMMFKEEVLPVLADTFVESEPQERRVLHLFGPREAEVADRLGDLLERGKEPVVGVTVRDGVISVTIVGPGADERAENVKKLLKGHVFADGDVTLPEAVFYLLKEKQLTLATAESVTGGLLASTVISVAGASAVIRGGFVTYNDELKHDVLGIPNTVLKKEGAVSAAVAGRMARAARQKAGADVGVATTGSAGPDRDPSGAPVGRVFVAVAGPKATDLVTKRHAFRGDRNAIRMRASLAALDLLRRHIGSKR